MSTEMTGSASYRLEPLNATNWMPWKRRITAVFRELSLDSYVTHRNYQATESKARTRLELAIGDSEMVHILGANTVGEIWDRLCQIKETKGRLGILA
ncbi:hypothetical protein FA15DRAFT_604776, partial [Coprinopsis marcescibilis]